jgi:hypothetical protein
MTLKRSKLKSLRLNDFDFIIRHLTFVGFLLESLEGPRMQESDDPLQLCVSAPSEESHKRAQEMVRELFVEMFSAFKRFKQEANEGEMPDYEIKIVEP